MCQCFIYVNVQWDICKPYRLMDSSLWPKIVLALLLLPTDHYDNQQVLPENSKCPLKGGATPMKKQ